MSYMGDYPTKKGRDATVQQLITLALKFVILLFISINLILF